jgi:hypothetical protein
MPIDPETGKRLPGRPSRAEMAAQASGAAPPADPPERPQTATERHAEIKRLRWENEGVIVPKPLVLTEASVRAWLTQVAAIGNEGDVDVCWLRVPGGGEGSIKQKLYNFWQDTRKKAERSYGAFMATVHAEREVERAGRQRAEAVRQEQTKLERLKREVAALERAAG